MRIKSVIIVSFVIVLLTIAVVSVASSNQDESNIDMVNGVQSYTYDMYASIKYIYPNITDDNFIVSDRRDGNGQFISKWDYSQPQPSTSDMKKAWIEVQNEQQLIVKMDKQERKNIGYDDVIEAPLVTELNDSYPVGGIVLYTDNLLYYKGTDGWHRMDGSKVN